MSAVLLVEFLVFLRPFISDRQEYNELIKYLEEIFHSCDERYKKSSEFKQLIQSTRSAIGNGKKNIYCYIAHLVSELQAHVKHSVERDDRSKSKNRHCDRNSGADSGELPKEQVNRNKDGSDVRINLPDDGIISENNAGKEADSAIVAADDGKGHSSPQAADLSNLTLALRLVDLQPVKVDSVSAFKCADVHPEPTSTSYKESTDNPSCSKEQDFMSVVDGQNSAVSENGDSQREILLSFLVFLKPLITDRQEVDDFCKYAEKLFNKCDESFRKSSDFKRLIQSTRSAISNDKQRVYVHIMDFVQELKAHGKYSAERNGKNKMNVKHKRRKRDRGKNSGSDSGELSKKKANRGKGVLDVPVDAPDYELVSENNGESPHTHSTCSPSASPAKKSKLDSDAAESDKVWIVLKRNTTPGTGSSSEVTKRANATDGQLPVQKDADSPLGTVDDGSECHSSPFTAGSSTSKLIPRRVNLQPAKVESVSTPISIFKCVDPPSELASTPNRATENTPFIQKEKNFASVVNDKKEYRNSSSKPPSTSKEKVKVKPSYSKDQHTVNGANASPSPRSTSKQKVKPSCSKVQNGVQGANTSSNPGSASKKEAKIKPSCSENQDDKKTDVSEKQIRQQEIYLAELRNIIESFKKREMSLDELDDENSCYMCEDKLERKFVKVWDKLCELKGRPKTTGRPVEKRFRFEGTRFPEINKKIRRLINKKNIFPELHDITDIIMKVNKTENLCLSSERVKDISNSTFQDVGYLLKERRRQDFLITFNCRLPDCVNLYDDPALTDPELEAKLERNRLEGDKKLNEVFLKYVREQESEELAKQSGKEKREMSCSPTNEEKEEVCVPKLYEVLSETVDDQRGDNSTEMDVGGNDGMMDVIELSTDEDKDVDDAQSDEDRENDKDTQLPRNFAASYNRKKNAENHDSQV